MEEMDIGIILEDLKSIKLPKDRRVFVNVARDKFRENGCISADVQKKLRRLVRLYRKQFEELHASRARARRTNWKLREGISEKEAQKLVERRRREVARQKADLGI
jgi:hypothetical protein